jgi:flagellar assembly factor FliW
MSSAVMDTQPTNASAAPADTTLDLTFVSPLWGIPHVHTYALSRAAREGLWWLQSHEEPVTTFVLADPFVVQPSYFLDLGDAEREALDVQTADEVIALVLLTLPEGAGQPVTANFRAPVVVNLRSARAMQVVNRDEAQQLATPIALNAYSARGNMAADG